METRKLVIAAAIWPVIVFVAWDRIEARRIEKKQEMRAAMLSYLTQPKFSGGNFLTQLTGVKGNFELLDMDERMVYVTIPKKQFQGAATLAKLTEAPKRVEFARDMKAFQQLGDLRLYQTDIKFFRFPVNSFLAEPETIVESKLSEGIVKYRVSVAELTDYLENRSVLGGPRAFQYLGVNGLQTVIANHGAFVSRGGEPSLERFVKSIRERAKSREVLVNALLLLVSKYIEYDDLEVLLSDVQVMKRAPEVLLTKRATCSGKTILFASLLQQVGVEHLLAYMPGLAGQSGHIGVLVAAGNFPNVNGYEVAVFGKKYQYAETTVPAFQIGLDRLKNHNPAEEIRFVQAPGFPVMDRSTGKPLESVDIR